LELLKDWRDALDKLPRCIAETEPRPQEIALIVVDMQNYIANSKYGDFLKKHYPRSAAYYYDRVEKLVIPNLARLLTFFRVHDLRVVFVVSGSELSDKSDGAPLRRSDISKDKAPMVPLSSSFEPESVERKIVAELAARPNELLVRKVTSSAFNSTGIDQRLRNMGVHSLVFTGVISHGCVESTLRDAVDLGYPSIMVEDAVAGFDRELDEACFRNIDRLYAPVWTTRDLMARLATASNKGN
jgi:nicotinamidase-related amidase